MKKNRLEATHFGLQLSTNNALRFIHPIGLLPKTIEIMTKFKIKPIAIWKIKYKKKPVFQPANFEQ